MLMILNFFGDILVIENDCYEFNFFFNCCQLIYFALKLYPFLTIKIIFVNLGSKRIAFNELIS